MTALRRRTSQTDLAAWTRGGGPALLRGWGEVATETAGTQHVEFLRILLTLYHICEMSCDREKLGIGLDIMHGVTTWDWAAGSGCRKDLDASAVEGFTGSSFV